MFGCIRFDGARNMRSADADEVAWRRCVCILRSIRECNLWTATWWLGPFGANSSSDIAMLVSIGRIYMGRRYVPAVSKEIMASSDQRKKTSITSRMWWIEFIATDMFVIELCNSSKDRLGKMNESKWRPAPRNTRREQCTL